MKHAFYLMLLSLSLFAVGCQKGAEQPAAAPSATEEPAVTPPAGEEPAATEPAATEPAGEATP